MKKIILFTGGVETLDFFSLQLEKGFIRLGHKVFVFDMRKEEECLEQLLIFYETDNTVMLSFNFTGIRGDDIFYDFIGELFWNAYRIPCYNIVVDHPFYYHELISRRPKRYHQLCVDRDHVRYMKRFFPEVRTEGFMPLAGTELEPYGAYPSLEERPIDIIFTGNYKPPHSFDKHITRIDEEYTAFYHSIIDALISDPSLPMEKAFELYLTKEMGELSEEELKLCMENMIFLDLYVRFYFRGEVIRTLVDHGFQVHVFGSGWKELECEHPENLIDGDSLDSLGCLQRIRQAKISLNVMPWFKDGAHDRIFNSMLNGALCLSDSSSYLKEEFVDDRELVYYSLSQLEKLPDIVEGLLNNPGRMKTIIKAGYRKAEENHTWNHRATLIDGLLRS